MNLFLSIYLNQIILLVYHLSFLCFFSSITTFFTLLIFMYDCLRVMCYVKEYSFVLGPFWNKRSWKLLHSARLSYQRSFLNIAIRYLNVFCSKDLCYLFCYITVLFLEIFTFLYFEHLSMFLFCLLNDGRQICFGSYHNWSILFDDSSFISGDFFS